MIGRMLRLGDSGQREHTHPHLRFLSFNSAIVLEAAVISSLGLLPSAPQPGLVLKSSISFSRKDPVRVAVHT